MRNHPRIEKLFHHRGLKCVILFQELGHRCGYVAVPVGHPLYGLDYGSQIFSYRLADKYYGGYGDDFGSVHLDSIIDVHGGLTFASPGKPGMRYPTLQLKPVWWFGFDCAHLGDGRDHETQKKYFVDPYLMENFGSEDTTKSAEYVEAECVMLVSQIHEITHELEIERAGSQFAQDFRRFRFNCIRRFKEWRNPKS